jgi:hypothetical protein
LLYKYIASKLNSRLIRAKATVVDVPQDLLFSLSEDEIARSIVDRHGVDEPRLQYDDAFQENLEEENTSGRHYVRFRVVIPIEGDTSFLPQHIQDDYIRGAATIEGNCLFLTNTTEHQAVAQIGLWMSQDLNLAKRWQSEIHNATSQYQRLLEAEIAEAIQQRKHRISQAQQELERLQIPMKRSSPDVQLVAIPVARRQPPIQKAVASEASSEPEYYLAASEYDFILDRLCRIVDVMERSPGTFARMGEQELRDILLVILNGHYKPAASGEAFNGIGKTDILLRFLDREAFIGECKVWKGAKPLADTITQLFGYTMWRDTKCASLVFNKTTNLSTVLNRISTSVPNVRGYVRDDGKRGDTHFRYVFRHPRDIKREVSVAVLVFDVPRKSAQLKPSPEVDQGGFEAN